MKIEDFTFKKHDGFTYVTFSEEITKTRRSRLRGKYRVQIPKMFKSRNDRCPLKIFRTYSAKRPADLGTSFRFTWLLSSITHRALFGTISNGCPHHKQHHEKLIYLFFHIPQHH